MRNLPVSFSAPGKFPCNKLFGIVTVCEILDVIFQTPFLTGDGK